MAMGVFSALVGLTIAFYANVAAGGAVVLTAVGILILVEVGVSLKERLGRSHGFLRVEVIVVLLPVCVAV